MKKNLSYRILDPETINFRAEEENGQHYLIGYASVFSHLSKPIFEQGKLFREIIAPGAFDELLASQPDVRLLFNHDRNQLLARTISGTLTLEVDEKGLLYKALMPNTQLGQDTYEMVKRGDIFENSFGFAVRKGDDTWTVDEEGNNIRTINKISYLYDVSAVIDGAYSTTSVEARNNEDRSTVITITINNNESEDPEEEPEEVEDPSTGTTGSGEETDDDEIEKDTERFKLELERMKMHLRMLNLKN